MNELALFTGAGGCSSMESLIRSRPMKIKAIAPWFGGKRTLAPKVVQQLGKHTQYFEPFCGSMAVLFAKEATPQETVNDLHNDLTNLAWVLQDQAMAVDLYDRITRVLFSESFIRAIWKDLAESEFESPCSDRAFKYLVFSWAMRNGVSGTARMRGNGFQMATRFTPGGGSPTVRFRSAIESIPEWHDRLRNVVILNRDGLKLLDRFEDSEKLAIYADPPYMPETRSGYESSGATSRYEHEFDHNNPMFGDDHLELKETLSRFKKARVVVSYYDCDRLRRLYDGWNFIKLNAKKMIKQQNARGRHHTEAPEVLIVNGEVLE